MKLAALAVLPFLFAPGVALAQSDDAAPSGAVTVAADSAASPRVVYHRSSLEELAALPGTVAFLPFDLLLTASEFAVAAVWEQRLLDRFKSWLTTADGRLGVRPLASTSIGTGARLFYKDAFGFDAELTSSRGTSSTKRNHHILVLDLPRGLLLRGRSHMTLRYRKQPGESFYGIGNDSRLENRSRFLQEDMEFSFSHSRLLGDALRLDAGIGYHSLDIREGEYGIEPGSQSRYSAAQVAGIDGLTRLIEADLGLDASFVDVPGSPTAGNKTLVRAGYTRALKGEELSHASLTVVTEQFHQLLYRRILSLRLGVDWRQTIGDDRVPFYALAKVGGDLFVRGYDRGRFRDRGAAFATLTYKYPIWKLVDGTLFYEGGRTFHSPDELTFDDWHPSYGGGVRIWVPDGVVFQQSISHSSEQTRLLFSFRTDF